MAAPDGFVGQPVSMNEMVEGPAGHAQGISSMHLAGLNQENKVDSVSIRIADGSLNEYARASSQTIVYGGVGYHMVNWLVPSVHTKFLTAFYHGIHFFFPILYS